MNSDLKVLIIEDEKPAARSLARRLAAYGFQDIPMLHSVAQGKAWFASQSPPDLIFMDIQLSDGLSFEILADYPVESKIIFTTAYNEFAIQAFKLNSIDYLLKPIMDTDLQYALDKFFKNHKQENQLDFMHLRELLLGDSPSYKTRFNVKIGQQIKIIAVAEIECIYSENKGTYMYCRNSDTYLLDQPLERIEEQLDPKLFFRINRGQIIALEAIKNIAIHSNSRLKIVLNHFPSEDCIVSRERVQDFKNWID